MKQHLYAFCILSVASFFPVPAKAANGWDVELFGGSAQSFRTNLKIEQAGQQDIDFTARYKTRPFSDAPYYSLRMSKWKDGRAWELELIHHKVYLDNNPPEVQNFEVSHGYNMILVNRAERHGDTIYHYGFGPVIAHTESTIRGLDEDTGYSLDGVAIQLAAGKRFAISANWFISLEGKLTAAFARVGVASGEASVPNVALHGLIGVGHNL